MRKTILSAIAFLICGRIAAEYPVIKDLSAKDLFFRQLQDQIETFNVAQAGGKKLPELAFYRYALPATMDFFVLSARFSLPFESIATLNRIRNPDPLPAGTVLLIPSVPGLFIAPEPGNDLELLVSARDRSHGTDTIQVTAARDGKVSRFTFVPGARFNGSERTFFLNAMFRYPLPRGIMTSGYGTRVSPITGQPHFHGGIDLAAREGTEVLAAREGKIMATGTDPVLGIYVIIAHQGGWQSVYGHLSSSCVELNQSVKSGIMIGLVGSTGMSTGPHLHFELRNGGESRNPETFIPRTTK